MEPQQSTPLSVPVPRPTLDVAVLVRCTSDLPVAGIPLTLLEG